MNLNQSALLSLISFISSFSPFLFRIGCCDLLSSDVMWFDVWCPFDIHSSMPPTKQLKKQLSKFGFYLGKSIGEGSYSKVYYSEYDDKKTGTGKSIAACKVIDRRSTSRNYLQKFLPRELEWVYRALLALGDGPPAYVFLIFLPSFSFYALHHNLLINLLSYVIIFIIWMPIDVHGHHFI